MDDEQLRVPMAVEQRAAARRGIDEEQRDWQAAVLGADEPRGSVRGLVRGHLGIGTIQALVRRTADGETDLAIVDLPLGPQGNRVKLARSPPNRSGWRSPLTIHTLGGPASG